MKKPGHDLDWNQMRGFVVTAETGSLSAAARALGQTQPTLGRQVAALEERLGVRLFERIGRGLELTPSGRRLAEELRPMAEAAGRFSLVAAGQEKAIDGLVRITANEMTAAYRLPPVVARLREIAPGIEVEIVASDKLQDLQRREADIALRNVRPAASELVARRMKGTTAHLYGATALLDRIGRPERATDLARMPFIGFDRGPLLIQTLRGMGASVTPEQFRVVTASGIAMWEMVKQGLGIGFMVRDMAEGTPGVEQVLPTLPAVDVPLWLTAHREVQTSRRVRLVFDLLAEAFG